MQGARLRHAALEDLVDAVREHHALVLDGLAREGRGERYPWPVMVGADAFTVSFATALVTVPPAPTMTMV